MSRSRDLLVGSALMLLGACERPPLTHDGGLTVGSGDAGNAGGGGVGGTGSAGNAGSAGSASAGGGGSGGTQIMSGSAGVSACGTIEQTSGNKILPDILILLDASGSMDEDSQNMTCGGLGCGPDSKWAQATAALKSIVAQTESTVNWGLKMFPDPGGSGSCQVPATPTIPIARGNAGAVTGAIEARTGPSGGLDAYGSTPTRAAEQLSADYLVTIADTSPKVILLLTDGAPNCMPGATSDVDDSAGAIQAVMDARTRSISTIVVGIATADGPADKVLNDMAVAGGFPRNAPAPASAYYPVTNIGELTSTLTLLVSTATECVFVVPPPPAGSTLKRIALMSSGTEIPFDKSHRNGWDYVNTTSTSVQVFGPVCDDFLAGRIASLTIVFYCDTH